MGPLPSRVEGPPGQRSRMEAVMSRAVMLNRNRRRRVGVVVGGVSVVVALLAAPSSAQATGPQRHGSDDGFRQVNLVSDRADIGAKVIDPAVRNPWGIAFGPQTPLWVANNFNPAASPEPTKPSDLLVQITVYTGANGKTKFQKVPLEVTASAATGIVFNPTSQFKVKQVTNAPARFIFEEATFDPTAPGPPSPIAEISGWHPDNPLPTTTVVKATRPGTFYTGLALVKTEDGARLLAAANANGGIDVYNGNFKRLNRPHAYVDPKAQAENLAPYNVAALNGRVYVTYATQQGGGGAVSVFTRDGRFLKRLVTAGVLNDPWGLAIAPEHWGKFGGDLLVGNVDDGTINAFDPHSGKFRGTLSDSKGRPIVNLGLWGIQFGNGVIGTPQTLVFAAGIGDKNNNAVYEHGLVGLIVPNDD
jgi:uncharacterized protein (TIGR03118 family)